MAFERLLTGFPASRLVFESEDLLVVDKPASLVVHGGDTELGGDLVSRLQDLLRGRGDADYLGVHQRLDVGTSGVIAFARSPAGNTVLASSGAEKRYVALVELGKTRLRVGEPLVLEHQILTERGESRVVQRGGKLARCRVTLRERRGGLGLCEVELATGRTHQIRVQLAAIGAPVAGDPIYGARARSSAPRLLLHASELVLADGRKFSAPLPSIFRRVLAGEAAALASFEECRAALLDAGSLRWPLRERGDVFRLVNDAGDGLPGVTLDRYGDFAVLSAASAEAEALASELAAELVRLGARGVYLKRRARTDLRRADHGELAAPLPVAGEAAPERLLVEELGMKLWVELGSGLSTGLFVDQRDGRARVRALSGGARVLNLFAYTCSFSVAAALGGARHVTSVDLSGRVLEWGRDNFRENALEPAEHAFEQADAVAWLAQAGRAGARYELVILDPPSFSSEGGGKAFSARNDYGAVAERALGVLAARGRLLAVTNHRGTSLGKLRQTLRSAAERAGRGVAQLKDLPSPLDCPPLADGPHPSKAVLLTLGD
jgi:23S rRNA (cytosine1962-C5)-methyltransferase